jgi:hypothetical protein
MAPRARKPSAKAAATKASAAKSTKVTPAAIAKAKAASARVTRSSQAGSPTRDTSPAPTEPEQPPDQRLDDALGKVDRLEDALEEIRDRFDTHVSSIDTRLDALTELLQGNAGLARTTSASGMTPNTLISQYLPWLDQGLLSNVVSRKLEVRELVKLLPEEDRPKGRAAAGLASGFHFDATTGKTTVVAEQSSAFDKDIPDFQTGVYILSIYGAIRAAYDPDNTGIGTAILLHIKQLTRWYKIDRFTWSNVRAYFIAHFRKYQTSSEPRNWTDIDLQLFAAYMRHPDTGPAPSSQKHGQPPKPRTSFDVCNNWNTEGKGCTWKKCSRKHSCSQCGKEDHPAYQCKKIDQA